MVISSKFEGGRPAVSFDRVELEDDSHLHPFELSRKIDLEGAGVSTLTWVYDRIEDAVLWSAPVETLFGFAPGVRGFAVNGAPSVDVPCEEGSGHAGPIGPELHLDYADPTDLGLEILAPILAPIRAGAPVGEYDLRTRVCCPDGTEHHLVIRASTVGDSDGTVTAAHRFDPETYLTGVIVDVTAQSEFEQELGSLVDRYRLLTEVSPDLVVVHQNGLLVYGNRAAVKKWNANSMTEYYGHPITDFIHPGDVAVLDELAVLGQGLSLIHI